MDSKNSEKTGLKVVYGEVAVSANTASAIVEEVFYKQAARALGERLLADNYLVCFKREKGEHVVFCVSAAFKAKQS